MDGEIDLRTADRDVLIGIIIRQQAIIERLEKRIAQSEGKGKSRRFGTDARPEAQRRRETGSTQEAAPAPSLGLCPNQNDARPAYGARAGAVCLQSF